MSWIFAQEFHRLVNGASLLLTEEFVAFQKNDFKRQYERGRFYRHGYLFPDTLDSLGRAAGRDARTPVQVDFRFLFSPFRGNGLFRQIGHVGKFSDGPDRVKNDLIPFNNVFKKGFGSERGRQRNSSPGIGFKDVYVGHEISPC